MPYSYLFCFINTILICQPTTSAASALVSTDHDGGVISTSALEAFLGVTGVPGYLICNTALLSLSPLSMKRIFLLVVIAAAVTFTQADPICIVGAGPAGLTVANGLQAKGFETVIFEKNPEVGGKCQAYYDEL